MQLPDDAIYERPLRHKRPTMCRERSNSPLFVQRRDSRKTDYCPKNDKYRRDGIYCNDPLCVRVCVCACTCRNIAVKIIAAVSFHANCLRTRVIVSYVLITCSRFISAFGANKSLCEFSPARAQKKKKIVKIRRLNSTYALFQQYMNFQKKGSSSSTI